MPLLAGHHGERHHFTTAMRTKEYLKFYYPSFVHDHTITFNVRDIDLEGTPPDDLQDFLHQLRERAPEEDQMSTFTKACRLHSERIDASAASTFHQRLVEASRLDDAAKFLSFQGCKSAFLVYPSGPRSPLIPYSPTRNTLQRCDRTSLLQSAGGSKGRPSVAAVPPTQ